MQFSDYSQTLFELAYAKCQLPTLPLCKLRVYRQTARVARRSEPNRRAGEVIG